MRRSILIQCNKAAKEELEFDSDALSALIADEESQAKRYKLMFGYALTTFLKAHEQWPSKARTGAGVGFKVATELLAIAPHAFARYCGEQAIEPNLTTLNQALHASTETPLQLMNLPDSTNSKTEQGLGLRTGFTKAKAAAKQGAFRFVLSESGLVFQADAKRFAKLAGEPDYEANPWLPEHWQRCPARRLVTERIWPAMVDLATETPAIFAHDLGIRDTADSLPA